MEFLRNYNFSPSSYLFYGDSDTIECGIFCQRYDYNGHTHISFRNKNTGKLFVINQFSFWKNNYFLCIKDEEQLSIIA